MSEHLTVCKALAAMLKQKGEISEEEVTFVAHAAFELRLSPEENEEVQRVLQEGDSFDELIAQVTSRPMRTFLFRRVVAAVLLDDEIEESEQELINRTATAFGYDDELREAFVAWMKEGIAWEKRGAALMSRM